MRGSRMPYTKKEGLKPYPKKPMPTAKKPKAKTKKK
jgi:hypothetical protein